MDDFTLVMMAAMVNSVMPSMMPSVMHPMVTPVVASVVTTKAKCTSTMVSVMPSMMMSSMMATVMHSVIPSILTRSVVTTAHVEVTNAVTATASQYPRDQSHSHTTPAYPMSSTSIATSTVVWSRRNDLFLVVVIPS